MFKTAMHVNVRIYAPDGRAEALNGTELVPFGGLSVVDFQCYVLTNLVRSTADHHHDGAKEDRGMLVTRCGCLTRLVRRFDPVPTAISVTSKAPRVTKTRLIRGSATEAYHHTSGAARLAEGR